MKNNSFKVALLAILALGCVMSVANAQKKEKKEKKAFEWKMPDKLTDIKNFDEYLLKCDTLWTKIQTYRDSIHFFRVDTIPVIDKETNTPYLDIQIVDENGNKRNWMQSIGQGADMIFTGTNIVLDAATITMMTVTAGTSLTENPLLAFSYGKYLKAGPKIVSLAYSEVKEIVNTTKKQMKDMKQIHSNRTSKSTDTDILIPIPEGMEVSLEDCKDLATIDMGTGVAGDLPAELAGLDLDNDLTVPDTKK